MARDGNGVDLGTVTAMLTHLVEITEGTRDEMAGMKRDVGELKRDVGDLKVKVADLDGQVASLRSEVRDYHGTVMGHGILYTELEERVRRIETHLDLPPGSH